MPPKAKATGGAFKQKLPSPQVRARAPKPHMMSNPHLMALRKAAGVADAKKDARIGCRISAKLVRLAKKKAGIKSDTALIEAGLLALVTEDEFGRWLVAQAGRLDRDFGFPAVTDEVRD